MKEIRWHGRGGQGVVTASEIVAEAAIYSRKYVQAYPQFGAERMGAPVTAFTRVSESKIKTRSSLMSPNIIVIIDSSLLSSTVVNVVEGLRSKGKIILNIKDVGKYVNSLPEKCSIFKLNADKIARNTKSKMPNLPCVAAVVKVSGIFNNIKPLEEVFRKRFEEKLDSESLENNLNAMSQGYKEVEVVS